MEEACENGQDASASRFKEMINRESREFSRITENEKQLAFIRVIRG
jgi:hypothetical protein